MRDILDDKVVPVHYILKIKIQGEGFSGEECVRLEVKEQTKTFKFNSSELELSNMEVRVNDTIMECEMSECEKEVVSVKCSSNLQKGDHVRMNIKFKGKYSSDMWGFYKSKYNEDDLYSTDFEPTNARRAFPCWDQPDMKATFDISVEPLEGYMALSNSSLKEIKDGVYYFNTTPKMSTYIVAYISGKLEAFTTKSKRGVLIKVYSHKDEKDWGEYSGLVAAQCLDFFEEYFDFAYPLPKLDLVTIPTFVSGAMENWGLVTFRKTSLLYKKGSSSIKNKKLISETVCHELAHMWFGNLVTMKWWNDLWLNEGFATWAASLALSNLTKDLVDWDVWTDFFNDNIECGMRHDCLESSHPIAVTVNHPSEISQIFDTISYSKGASMIRMLEGYIGPENFMNGIRNYLKKFKYGNATTDDLWNSFPKNLKVDFVMNDWITRQGFPVLEITDSALVSRSNLLDTEYKQDDTLRIKQSIFLCSGKETNDLWKIPVNIKWYNPECEETILIIEKDIKLKKKSSVYKLNNRGCGFFRVRYQIQNMASLLEQDLSPVDKLNLVNDLFAFITARRTKAIDGIIFSELFTKEQNSKILCSVLSNLWKLKSIFYDVQNVLRHLDEVIFDIVQKRARRIDMLNCCKNTEETLCNSLLLKYALLCGDNEVKSKCRKAYDLFSSGEVVCPEYKDSFFASVADSKTDEIFTVAKTSSLPNDRSVSISALSYVEDPTILTKVLNRYQEIEPHNSLYFFVALSNNIKNRNLILNFVYEKFDEIRSFMKNDRLFQYVIEHVFGTTSSYPLSDKIIELLETRKGGEISMAICKTVEKINHNVKFREYNGDLITHKD